MSGLIEQFLAGSSFPNLHPLLVHFPLALLPLGVLFDVGATFLARRWLDRTALVFYALGVGIGWWAMEEGEHAAESFGNLAVEIERDVTAHSDWAHRAIYVFAGLLALRLLLSLRDRGSERVGLRAVRAVLTLAGAAGLFFLYETVEHGGTLVYDRGLGVQVSEPAAAAGELEVPIDASTPAERMAVSASGGRVWVPESTDVVALGSVMTLMAEGGTLTAVPDEGGPGLTVDFAGTSFLLFPGRYGDVRVEATLEVSDFRGSFGLAHHVGSADEARWFSITSDGRAGLVTREAGNETTLDQAMVELSSGRVELIVSSIGRHRRGLVGDAVVVHGHGSPADAGQAGLYFNGSGRLRIVRVVVEPA